MILPRDLRLRIVAATTVIILVSPITGLLPGTVYVVCVLGIALTEETALPWRKLMHLEAFLLLLLITLPFTLPGTPIFRIGPLTASWKGTERAIVVALKVTGSMLLLNLCFAHVETVRLGEAMRGLAVPEPLVRIFLGLVRYLGVIRTEFTRLQEAMVLRSFRPRSTMHTWRSYGNMIGMLLLRAMHRAERVEEAMRLRSYSGHFPTRDAPPISLRDWTFTCLLIGAATLLLIWDLT